MTIALNPRDRRVLAVGLLTCCSLVIVTRGFPALVRWTRAARENAAQLTAEAARAASTVGSAHRTVDSLRARNARYAAIQPRLLDAETVAGAGSALASLISTTAAASGVRLGSVQIHTDTVHADAFLPIRVHADLVGDINGLSAMLATLERGRTPLAVRELSIEQPELAAGDDRAESLRAELTVESLMPNPARVRK